MDLKYFCNQINLPQEAINIVENYKLSNDKYVYYRKVFDDSVENFYEEVKKNSDYRQLFLYLYVKFAIDVYDEYKLRKIEDKVFFDTFIDITLWCENCFYEFGEYGINEYHWLFHHIQLKIFRLGRLQFQPSALGNDVYIGDKKYSKGTLMLSVHIPRGTPLYYEDLKDSYRQAEQFFRGIPPIFTCYSWLLYPDLKAILKPDSNITVFKSFYKLENIIHETRDAEKFIFTKVEDNPENYPERTSLQRSAKQHFLSGGKLGCAFGVYDYTLKTEI